MGEESFVVKTVLVLVDAMKSAYITKDLMPFLSEFSRQNYCIKNIYPSAGFCERSEIFTGLDCYDSGSFGAIGYDPTKSPYRSHKLILRLAGLTNKVSPRGTGFFLRKYRQVARIGLSTYRIPPQELCKFFLTEDGEEQLIKYESIFDAMDRKNISYTMNAFTSLSDFTRRTNLTPYDFVEQSINDSIEFIPVYIGVIDQMGHRFGADIDSMKVYLSDVDSSLEKICRLCDRNNYCLCILGDHGMVPISEHVNVPQILQDCKAKQFRDYDIFIDSTMLRCWFYSNKARNEISVRLGNALTNKGKFITETNYKEYRIPLDIKASDGKPVYGELLWCADPGVLLVPDFFNPVAPADKGMHGYLVTDEVHGTGFFASNNKRGYREAGKLFEICGELCEMLEIDVPNAQVEWRREISVQI